MGEPYDYDDDTDWPDADPDPEPGDRVIELDENNVPHIYIEPSRKRDR